MPRYFSIYWRPDGWTHLKPGEAMTYAGGNQFKARGIKTGDRAYVLNLSGGQVRLLGAIDVTDILSTAQARRRGSPIWLEADEHLVGTSQGNFGIRSIPLEVAKQLRFITPEGSVEIKLDQTGQVDRQTLRGVRELTAASAQIFDAVLGASGDSAAADAGQTKSEQNRLRGGPDRTSAQSASQIIDVLLAGTAPANRKAVLRFLTASIDESARIANDRWAVKLDSDHVRFNVGKTESIVLWGESISVLVKSDARISGTSLNDPYPSAGGSRLRSVPYELAGEVLPLLQEPHALAKQLARRHPCTRVIMDAHSPGVVDYLWEALGLAGMPPEPTYYRQVRRPLNVEKRRAALVADKMVDDLPDLKQTEKEVVIKQRLAQRLFRQRLKVADCRCRVTGVSDPAHLRASHIKPWSKCSDHEKQDPANGLLLAPHVDHLFDAGHISFDDDGTMRVSRRLEKSVLGAWGLEPRRIKGAKFSAKQAGYLGYHRKHVFEKKGLLR